MSNLPNGSASSVPSKPVRVNVNGRALVDKVLARYPEEFTVFRELLQNADDAQARSVEIHFQTSEYVTASEKALNGSVNDLNTVRLFRWVVRNDGDPFTSKDWQRLTNIADGNPDEQKIGAFGVGFFSVFSVTECPVVVSGGIRTRMFYDDNELFVDSKLCGASKWTTFEMDLKPGVQTTIPKPFDLSRFISAAVTFLISVKEVTVLFNGAPLSKISKSRGEPVKIDLPADLKASSPAKSLTVKSVKTIAQQVEVVISALAYSAGSKKLLLRKKAKASQIDPAKKRSFFGKNAELNDVHTLSVTGPSSEKTFSIEYTVYSAEVSSTPSQEMTNGIESATKKKPPKSFLFEAVHFTMNECGSMTQGDDDDTLGSIFRGSQGLLNDQDGEHSARLFVGQSTAQTTGIAVHLSTRFIPTVERGLIDLANGQVQKWNEELLYIGGLVARLIYGRAMDIVRNAWPSGANQAHKEGLFIMKSFTFRPSTPDPKVADLLRNAFFECSTGPSFPIVSNLGIRDSRDVREPHATFAPFMKQRPVLDNSLLPVHATMIADLPKRYKVSKYTFRDVKEELQHRTLLEHEMVACVAWWVGLFGEGLTGGGEKCKGELIPVAKFSPAGPRESVQSVRLIDIRKFVNPRGSGSFITADDPLPPDTIPVAFTVRLDPRAIRTSLGWEEMTLLDWVRYLISPGRQREHDIRLSTRFVNRFLGVLQSLWNSLEPVIKEQIIGLMQNVEFIPTSRGRKKPDEAYFLEADLFSDLPVVQNLDVDDQILQELGVRRNIPWCDIKGRLPHRQCSPYRLATYLERVYNEMRDDEHLELQRASIFSSESGEFYCIADLYTPEQYHIELGLPIIRWRDSAGSKHPSEALTRLSTLLGLRAYPPLDVIIRKAASPEIPIRRYALQFLLTYMDTLYSNYNPLEFADVAFLPCGRTMQPSMGTPEQVFISADWEPLGFKKLHHTITEKDAVRLKIKERPSASAIIDVLKKTPPKNKKEAVSWFELLASKGGFNAEERKELANLRIVPIPTKVSAGESTTDSVELVRPRQCFFELPGEANSHHRELFSFVRLSTLAHNFLDICGAKPKPDYVDIVEALLRDAHNYLQVAGGSRYLDDLRQVAVGYNSLPSDVKARMKNAEIFLAYRRKREPDSTVQSREMALKGAKDILIADDMESLRLFGDHVFVAPKEEVFDQFYRILGAETLSAHVVHVVEHEGTLSKDAADLRMHILERVKIFLYDQDSSRRSKVNPIEWHNEPEKFAVKYCRNLQITKYVEFRHVSEDRDRLREKALAGVEKTTEKNIVLWVKDDPSESKRDWYDMSVALCRLFFKAHKAHDTSSLMTILDAQLDDLKRRGYDVDFILGNVQDAPPPDRPRSPTPPSNPPPSLPLSGWLKDMKKRILAPKFKRDVTGKFAPGEMADLMEEALNLCSSDNGDCRAIHQNEERSEGGKKQRDVKYCSGLRQTDLKHCGITKHGMSVFKTSKSEDPPSESLEAFSTLLWHLGKIFDLKPEKLHVFWQNDDVELMGFNRSHAIYLNLAHFEEKHHSMLSGSSSDDDKAAVYTAWYFIIAHEIAHNKAFFHDEDHELLLTCIAQNWLTPLRKLLARVAPGTC